MQTRHRRRRIPKPRRSTNAIERERFLRVRNLCKLNLNGTPKILAIDPDLHATGLAWYRAPDWHVAVAKVPKDLTGLYAAAAMGEAIRGVLMHDFSSFNDLIVVEGQQIYKGGDKATQNPTSIMHLSHAAGAAIGAAMGLNQHAQYVVPTPQTWKGSVPKDKHQARTFIKLGWDYEFRAGYCVPTDFRGRISERFKFNAGDWKHVGDAVGLAYWAAQEIKRIR